MLVLAIASPVAADAINGGPPSYDPPPRDCPRGTIPVGEGHGSGGSHCRPAACETDEECGGEAGACRPFALCTQDGQSRNGTYTTVVGMCEDGAACEMGTCSVASRCANEPRPVPEVEQPALVVPE